MDAELKCNNVQCRHALSSDGKAIITSCSHAFCVQCANRSFSRALVCPACETSLPRPDDITCIDLNPSEDYKNSVLAGLRPETIVEISGRAISFWMYQMTHEAYFQSMLYKNLDQKYANLENQFQTMVNEANSELELVKEKLHEFEQERRRSQEVADQYAEKTRQFQKLQSMYDKMKRKAMIVDASSGRHTVTPEQQTQGQTNAFLGHHHVPQYRNNSFSHKQQVSASPMLAHGRDMTQQRLYQPPQNNARSNSTFSSVQNLPTPQTPRLDPNARKFQPRQKLFVHQSPMLHQPVPNQPRDFSRFLHVAPLRLKPQMTAQLASHSQPHSPHQYHSPRHAVAGKTTSSPSHSH